MHIIRHLLTAAVLSSSLSFAATPNGKAKTPAKDSSPTSDTPAKETDDVFAPCTIRSPNSGKFFDLNPLHVALPDPEKKTPRDARTESWHARGYDYGANFTMNFCGGVVEDLDNVVGVNQGLWKNVSAYYTKEGKTYSIGQLNTDLVIRGRKLLLNYTDGSPCPAHPYHDKRALVPSSRNPKVISAAQAHSVSNSRVSSPQEVSTLATSERRKSTVVSLLCEDEPTAPKVSLAFLETMDECTYFFELRSPAACPAVNVAKQQVGPSGVFGLIAFIAILVYLVGGIVYQRAVMHQRGWRQIPNYALWAGIVGFMSDMVIILFSSCMRYMPFGKNKDRGFNQRHPGINGDGYGVRSAARGAVDDENRIIDDLDEEWRD